VGGTKIERAGVVPTQTYRETRKNKNMHKKTQKKKKKKGKKKGNDLVSGTPGKRPREKM